MSSAEMVVKQELEKLYKYSTEGRTPTASRFLTLKAMVQLGNRWQASGEIMRQLQRLKIHTNYVYELAGKIPRLIEKSPDLKRVRIKDSYYPMVARLVDEYIVKIQRLKEEKRGEFRTL
jgi:hypothetical protein